MDGEKRNLWEFYVSRRMLAVLVFGLASGFPLALSGATLQAWMHSSGVKLGTIGLLSLAGLPYTLKFLWAPLIDSTFVSSRFGRRRTWLALLLPILAGLVGSLSFISPLHSVARLSVIVLLISFVSATFDIVVDAYRTELLAAEESAAGASVGALGYRLGMLLSGAGGLVLSDYLPWPIVFLVFAGILFLTVPFILISPEPISDSVKAQGIGVFLEPLRELLRREQIWIALLLVLLFRLPDNLPSALSVPFLLHAGYSSSEIGYYYKLVGPVALIVGGLVGGAVMLKISLYRALLLFGLLQSVSSLLYLCLVDHEATVALLAPVIFAENFSGGLATASYLALLQSLCARAFTGTQFALLSSLMALGRISAGAVSGYLVEAFGWSNFFTLSALLALPSLLLLIFCWSKIQVSLVIPKATA